MLAREATQPDHLLLSFASILLLLLVLVPEQVAAATVLHMPHRIYRHSRFGNRGT
jgi:hypothetical protein